jgi:hypothetical protein
MELNLSLFRANGFGCEYTLQVQCILNKSDCLRPLADTAGLKIGNPPRDFQLLIDSGSADFWVGGEGCHDLNGGDCVRSRNLYSIESADLTTSKQGAHRFLGANSSATCKITQSQWAIGYATGFVSGLLAQDDVSIGDLTIKNHTFGIALNETKDFTA